MNTDETNETLQVLENKEYFGIEVFLSIRRLANAVAY
jgi:hypothetical protein